jgi:hypothetical protein
MRGSVGKKPALGFIGASQNGKSYLVGEMARPDKETDLTVILPVRGGGQKEKPVNYLKEINPEANREATAITTRFTVTDTSYGDGWNKLLLFRRSDLVKILLNGALMECKDVELMKREELEQLIRQHTDSSGYSIGLMNCAEWQDIDEYVSTHFDKNIYIKFLRDHGYFEWMFSNIENLNKEETIKALGWLWGHIDSLSNLFSKLVTELERIGGDCVGIGQDALLPKENSILDVERLSEIYDDKGRKVEVLAAESGKVLSVGRGRLCALAREIQLRVADGEKNSLLPTMDFLDFPGARARQKAFSREQVERNQKCLVEVFLRGKVALLFDLANDNWEISSLLNCQKGGNQDAGSVPEMVFRWIRRFCGPTSDKRAGISSRFFQVFTQFDLDVSPSAGKDTEAHWDARLRTQFCEFMGRVDNWAEDWDGKNAFSNCFLVRNPNVGQVMFRKDKDTGLEYIDHPEHLEAMRSGFLNNNLVKRHFRNAEQAWDAVAMADRNGIDFLMENIQNSWETGLREKMIGEAMKEKIRSIEAMLLPSYIPEDIQEARKAAKARAQKRGRELRGNLEVFGRIMDVGCFSIPEETCKMEFFRTVHDFLTEEKEEKPLKQKVVLDSSTKDELDELFGADESSPEGAVISEETTAGKKIDGKAVLFARASSERWKDMVLSLPSIEILHRKTGLCADWFAEVGQNMVRSYDRLDIAGHIAELVESDFMSQNPAEFYARVSTIACRVINNFAVSFGESFEKPQQPDISNYNFEPNAFSGKNVLVRWSRGFMKNSEDNFGPGIDIPASNEALGLLLKDISDFLPKS